MTTSSEPLAGLSRVGECANASPQHSPVRKGFWSGTHRTIAPDETLSNVLRHAPALGLTRVANITGLDSIGIPVCVACRPNARSLAVSQGKGLDVVSAKASAVMESLEAFHAERITAPVKFATYNELRADHNVVDVEHLPRTGDSAFRHNAPLFWIAGYDIVSDAPIWVPFELVHLNYTFPPLPGSGIFVASSNGLASGNDVLEALSHGVCEMIERDAATLFALSSRSRRETVRLDLATIEDSAARRLLEAYDRAGVGVAVWEITSDVCVPAFSCSIIDRSPNPMRPLPPARGMGCHPVREVALVRALTEAAQSRLTVMSGSRDDLGEARYQHLLVADQQEAARHWICSASGTRHFLEAPTQMADTFEADVRWELQCLRRVGIAQAIAVDLTRPDFAIPVVRVVIPGLEALHDAPGYAPGRRARQFQKENGG